MFPQQLTDRRAFWAVVRSVVPDYEHSRRVLDAAPVPVLD